MVAAAAKEGKVVWYTSIDVKVAEADREGVSRRISEHRDRGRALGLGARVPAHQPGVPVGHQERRRRQLVRRVAFPLLEAAEVARAARAARRAALSRRSSRIRKATTRPGARRCRVMGYNTKLVDGQGRADRLPRSARPEMERQARQVASRLQRHEPDRHLRDRQGCSAGITSRSCRSRACSSCSRRPRRRRASPAASAR